MQQAHAPISIFDPGIPQQGIYPVNLSAQSYKYKDRERTIFFITGSMKATQMPTCVELDKEILCLVHCIWSTECNYSIKN